VERITLADREMIERQIGRRPRGLSDISRRCSYGFPQVVRVHPVVDGKPFPTLFWLTCPWLSREIDHLEAAGGVRRMEELLATDPELAAGLKMAEVAYIAERVALLSSEEIMRLRDRGMLSSLSDRGIGGISESRGLKCLHLHVAHALAAENPIGEAILDELGASECPRNEVICSALERAEQTEQINR